MNRKNYNKEKDILFKYFGMFCTALGLFLLLAILGGILKKGLGRIDWDFIISLPSRKPELAGIYPALIGSIWLMVLTSLIAFPIGVACSIYLEEYNSKSRLNNLLEINISNLAGVPSVVYGLLGLEVFVRIFGFGGSVLAGSMTLSLLILPIIIVATREAVKAVPKSIKEASFAMGATKWQTIWYQTLPAAFGGIMTGAILSISRIAGEAAPLIIVGALAYVPFAPTSPMDEFTVMPIQIFNWVSRPQYGFSINASAAIIVLLIIIFSLNVVASFFRNKWQKKYNW